MLVLGVDPGTAILGYGLVRQDGPALAALDYGVLRTAAGVALPDRLLALRLGLSELLHRYQPDAAAVEQLFFTRNVKTAISVAHARGVVLLTLAEAGLPVAEYTPLEVKQAVLGYGRGDKLQMQTVIRMLLALPQLPQPDDAADALAVAICHANKARYVALQATADGRRTTDAGRRPAECESPSVARGER